MENNNIEKNTNIEDNSNLEDKKNSKKMKPRTKKILSNVFLFSSLAAAFLCVTIIPFALNKKLIKNVLNTFLIMILLTVIRKKIYLNLILKN